MFNNIAKAFEKARLDSYIMSLAADNSDKQAKIDEQLQTKAKVIFEHKHELQQVFDMLSDRNSKQQYLNYLIYRILSNIDKRQALQNNPNMPVSRFQYYLSNIGPMIAANGLVPPALNAPTHYKLEMLYEVLCTFAIQQYVYPNYVDVTKDDVFLDCGSFIGDTVIWALQKGAQVYAFEPIKESMDLLKRNLRENGYSDQHCYQLGLSNTNQSLTATYLS